MYEKPLSLIVPCHNSAGTLPECLASLRNQTLGIENMHIILVDDASDDAGATLHLLRNFEDEFSSSVTVLSLEKNLRQGGARNRALVYVDTEYLQFLDSDDTLSPNACLDLLKIIDAEQGDLLFFGHSMPDDDFRINLPSIKERKVFLSSHAWNNNHSSKLYRSDLILNHNLHFAEGHFFEEPLFVYPTFFYASSIIFARRNFYHLGNTGNSTMQSKAIHQLMDHPLVQLELLHFLKSKSFLLDYYEEIEEYFLWSYFLETMINASSVKNSMSVADYQNLQEICLQEFPEWENNPYIQESPTSVTSIYSFIRKKIASREELSAVLSEIQLLSHDLESTFSY